MVSQVSQVSQFCKHYLSVSSTFIFLGKESEKRPHRPHCLTLGTKSVRLVSQLVVK